MFNIKFILEIKLGVFFYFIFINFEFGVKEF